MPAPDASVPRDARAVGTGRFGPAQRLHKRAEFDAVFRQAQKVVGRHFVCYWARRSGQEGGGSRLGLVVSRKVGKAVVRNRVKRRVREFFRTHQARFHKEVDLVVVARPSAAELDSGATAESLRRLLQRGELLDG